MSPSSSTLSTASRLEPLLIDHIVARAGENTKSIDFAILLILVDVEVANTLSQINIESFHSLCRLVINIYHVIGIKSHTFSHACET